MADFNNIFVTFARTIVDEKYNETDQQDTIKKLNAQNKLNPFINCCQHLFINFFAVITTVIPF